MAKEENSSIPATPNSGRKKGIRSYNNNRNRVEFRVPNDELWIYESMGKSLFENGYIHNPNLSETARFCLNLYAADHLAQGEVLIKKLGKIVPIAYHNRLVKELENEKQCSLLYKQASEALAACLTDPTRIIDDPLNR